MRIKATAAAITATLTNVSPSPITCSNRRGKYFAAPWLIYLAAAWGGWASRAGLWRPCLQWRRASRGGEGFRLMRQQAPREPGVEERIRRFYLFFLFCYIFTGKNSASSNMRILHGIFAYGRVHRDILYLHAMKEICGFFFSRSNMRKVRILPLN